MKLHIINCPEPIHFMNSLFTEPETICSSSEKSKSPIYRGEAFTTKDTAGTIRTLTLIPTSIERKSQSEYVFGFTAILWAPCEEFQDLIPNGSPLKWIHFDGEINFNTGDGWLEQIPEQKEKVSRPGEFPKYLMKINGDRKFLSFRDASSVYNAGCAEVSFGRYVLDQNDDVSKMTYEDKEKISLAADAYGENK